MQTELKNFQRNDSWLDKLQDKLLYWLRLTNDPVVKVYHGYGYAQKLVIFGHIFSASPLARRKYRKNIWTNTFALIRSFMVKTKGDAKLRLLWEGNAIETVSAKDGFFRFEWDAGRELSPGVIDINVDYINNNNEIITTGKGYVLVPFTPQHIFISDIDDTFLISHSASFWKKMYVLLTKNAHSRKPFEGVVEHYRRLAGYNDKNEQLNPFFYVSSSEWNLYSFIKEFIRKNNLPEGVFLLSQLKPLSQLLKTGGNKHATKFMRIARIMEAYPQQQVILLGDDSQQDPVIYSAIVDHFKGRVKCVYLRHVYEKNLTNVKELIKKIEAQNIPCCHFENSRDAIEHSYKIGLIVKEDIKTPA